MVLHLLDGDERPALVASARALARVTHPSLCRVHRIREGGASPCVVQGFMRGERLHALPVPLDANRLRAVGTALASALAALHAARVVHGDVRADRVVISPSGVPCLIGLRSARPDARPEAIAADVRALAATLAASADGALRDALQRFVAGAAFASAEELRLVLEPGAGSPPGSEEVEPYRGLRCFESEHAGLFFGRDEEIAGALGRLRGEPWLLVTAPSGAGKSSFVRAGLVPAITRGALGERARWDVTTCVPGPRPLAALARALAPAFGREPFAFEADLRKGPSLAGDLARARPPDEGGLLLVVDQLEETMTLAGDAERDAFLAVLAGFGAMAPGVRALMTLRSDFLDRLGSMDGALARRLLRAAYVLPAMSADALRLAVAGPAHARGFEMETPGMVDQLVSEGQPHGGGEALPLLSFLMAELWAERDRQRRVLPAAALARLGGAALVLARHGDTVLSTLSPEERRAARRILLSLVTSGRTPVRRTREELTGDAPAAQRALEALIRGRIVVAGDGYQIAHETLVRAWPRLRGWLDEASDERAAARRLSEAAAEWERLGRDPGLLWGARQAQDLELLGGLEGAGDVARAFAEASRAAMRRAQRLLLGLVLGIPLALAGAGGGAWGVSYARRRAAVSEALAQARALHAGAEEQARAAEEARARAFAVFETDDLEPAEKLWKEALAREEDTDQARRAVLAAAATALALDPRDAGARALAADVTLARLLSAERLYQDSLVGTLDAELDLYDDGSRRRWLRAPGHVTARTAPPGGKLVLRRYREDERGRLVEGDPLALGEGERRELAAGSYVVTAEAPGRYPTRYPFLLRRGEESVLRVVMPPAEEVPEGMIYVPAGRMLYGSGDDEALRRFLGHQPRHDVEVGAFYIARNEATNADYLAYLEALPGPEREAALPRQGIAILPDGRLGWILREKVLAPREPYCNGVQPCVDWWRLPFMNTNRDNAERYTKYLARSGRLPGARLCTDREWERAARGADGRRFPSGDADLDPADACTLALYGDDSLRAGPCLGGTHPASRSPFGVDDLAGNAAEWTSGVVRSAHGMRAITRGGGWYEKGMEVSIPRRDKYAPRVFCGACGVRVCADAR